MTFQQLMAKLELIVGNGELQAVLGNGVIGKDIFHLAALVVPEDEAVGLEVGVQGVWDFIAHGVPSCS